jgi:hypothetical protein
MHFNSDDDLHNLSISSFYIVLSWFSGVINHIAALEGLKNESDCYSDFRFHAFFQNECVIIVVRFDVKI